jgi:hypothetical protein
MRRCKMKQKTKSILDKEYGGLADTLELFYRAGIITKKELDTVMLHLVMDTGIEKLTRIMSERGYKG